MKGCDHKFVGSNHCLKCGWTPTEQDKRLILTENDITTRVFFEDGEYAVWIAPAGDLEDNNVINSFVAGVGDTRDHAIADAVRSLEAVVAHLQRG